MVFNNNLGFVICFYSMCTMVFLTSWVWHSQFVFIPSAPWFLTASWVWHSLFVFIPSAPCFFLVFFLTSWVWHSLFIFILSAPWFLTASWVWHSQFVFILSAPWLTARFLFCFCCIGHKPTSINIVILWYECHSQEIWLCKIWREWVGGYHCF